MRKCEIRKATQDDIPNTLGWNYRTKAWVMELDGKIVALGGVAYLCGRWYAFFDYQEEASNYKIKMLRAIKSGMDEMRRDGVKFIYAEADTDKPKAIKLLTSLGFEHDPITQYLYRWRA